MPEKPWSLSHSPAAWVQRWRQRWHPAWERLQRDPLARLTTLEEVPIAVALGVRIDVNQATIDDWLRLPGISIHQARTLTRLTQGGVAFHCLEDIAAVLGVSLSQLMPLRPLLLFCYYDPASSVSPTPVLLNQAPIAQLQTLPGMTSGLLERLINERRRSPFTDWADVQHRLRLTPDQTSRWLYFLRI